MGFHRIFPQNFPDVTSAADPLSRSFGAETSVTNMSATSKDDLISTNLIGIRGRTALITGATSGTGYMMAKGLIVNGIEAVFITGQSDDARHKGCESSEASGLIFFRWSSS